MWRIVADKILQDDILLRASGLAYSSLVSLVPVFAVVLAILSVPAFESSREDVLNKLASAFVPVEAADGAFTAGQDSRQDKFKQSFRKEIQALADKLATVSAFGFLLLVVTAGLLFNTVANAFNAIWRVVSQRPFFHRIAIATNLIFWGPLMLALSVSIGEYLRGYPVVGTFIVPTIFTSLAFTGFFMVMPYATVRFRCALAGGIAAAILWELAKLLFLIYVTRIVAYYQVYGSLGLIPMLFLWVYINWVLILAGAELAYCLQHHRAMVEQYLNQQNAARRASYDSSHPAPIVVLAAAIEIARLFNAPACRGVCASQLAQNLHVEIGVAQQAAKWLVMGGILAHVEITGGESQQSSDDPAFLPACAPDNCHISTLLTATFDDRTASGNGESWERAHALMQAIAKLDCSQYARLTLGDLLQPLAVPVKSAEHAIALPVDTRQGRKQEIDAF